MSIIDTYEKTDTLVHYGVKGQTWGVRRSLSELGRNRAEKKFTNKASSKKTYIKVYNRTADRVNETLPALNAKYSGKNLKDKKVWDSYVSEHKSNFERIANQELSKELGGSTTSPGGKKWKAFMNSETGYMGIFPDDGIKHADDMESIPELVFKLSINDDGFIIKYTVEDQSSNNDEELVHYGVKGQKWGVRRTAKELGRSLGGKLADRKTKQLENYVSWSEGLAKETKAEIATLEGKTASNSGGGKLDSFKSKTLQNEKDWADGLAKETKTELDELEGVANPTRTQKRAIKYMKAEHEALIADGAKIDKAITDHKATIEAKKGKPSGFQKKQLEGLKRELSTYESDARKGKGDLARHKAEIQKQEKERAAKEKARSEKKNPAKTMTNEQLAKEVKRMQLERNYNTEIAKQKAANATQLERATQAVQKQVQLAGQEVIKNSASSLLQYGINKAGVIAAKNKS